MMGKLKLGFRPPLLWHFVMYLTRRHHLTNLYVLRWRRCRRIRRKSLCPLCRIFVTPLSLQIENSTFGWKYSNWYCSSYGRADKVERSSFFGVCVIVWHPESFFLHRKRQFTRCRQDNFTKVSHTFSILAYSPKYFSLLLVFFSISSFIYICACSSFHSVGCLLDNNAKMFISRCSMCSLCETTNKSTIWKILLMENCEWCVVCIVLLAESGNVLHNSRERTLCAERERGREKMLRNTFDVWWWASVRRSLGTHSQSFRHFFLLPFLYELHKEREEWQTIFSFPSTHFAQNTFFTFPVSRLSFIAHGENGVWSFLSFHSKWKILMAIFILWLFFDALEVAHPKTINT